MNWDAIAAIGQVPGSLAVLVAVGTDRSFGSIRIARRKSFAGKSMSFSGIPSGDPLRVILGAGEQRWDGWVATQKERLDLLDRTGWEDAFRDRLADAFLCEHVRSRRV